jgi:hypothetical protein
MAGSTPPPQAPLPSTDPPPGGRRRLVLAAGAALAVLILGGGAAAGLLLTGGGGTNPAATAATPATVTPAASEAPAPAAAPAASPTASPTAAPLPSPAPDPGVPAFRFAPLWPFASAADAVAWQRAADPGGHQPWHYDPGATATAFAQTYLGYTEVGRVTGVRTAGDEAWVGVGADPAFPAAVLHLEQIGTGAPRPWEVVGSEDTTVSLTTPAYGTTAHSPLTVGGLITGVDEALQVQVRTLAAAQPIGRAGPIAAGGEAQPWTATVPLASQHPGLLTVAVSTGGHRFAVERFAITAVSIP